MDAVIAKGMAKQPDRRYASTVELARAARDATTVPLPRPGPAVPVYPRPAGPIHSRYTELAAAGAAPVLPPPSGSLVRPATVNVGFGLWLAASILIVIGGLVVALLSIDPAASDSEYMVGLVMTVGVGLFAVVLIFLILMRRGHRWARNLLTAGGTITVIVVVATLFISRSNASATMSNASAVTWSSGIVGSVLILGGIVLLHLKVAQAYFRHRKEVEAYFNRVAKNNRMPLPPPANHV
jgi:hypothetical protein